MKFCLLQTLLDNSLSDRILCTALDIFANLINIFQWTERRLNGPVFATSVSQSDNSSELNMEPMSLEFINSLWVPNIFIYNLKTYKVIDVLSKLAGLWIDTDKNVLYSQATHITFICPMRFDKFPLDTQTCRFRVGSYSYDSTKLLFQTRTYGYSSKDTNSIALDYDIRKYIKIKYSLYPILKYAEINSLSPEDAVLDYGSLGNFSLAGFEMVLTRYVSTYIITYYLPSGIQTSYSLPFLELKTKLP